MLIGFLNRPLDAYVTVEGIQTATGMPRNAILAKAGNCYYEMDTSDEFAALFQFENWELVSKAPVEEPVLTLQFAELWVVHFYEGGQAAAHNGYASETRSKGSAYYEIPSKVPQKVIDYLKENAIPHEFGDGTIGIATFRYE